MEFYLTYMGPLKSNAKAKEKHKIRKYIEPQLKRLWNIAPLSDYPEWLRLEPKQDTHNVIKEVGGYKFAPLITSKLYLVCQLDIVLLWPDEPGKIVGSGGDIDNRLKTLFDALTCPDENQVREVMQDTDDQDIFYCLLEDDKLITDVAVKTHTLLRGENSDDVLVLLHVKAGDIGLTLRAIDVLTHPPQ